MRKKNVCCQLPVYLLVITWSVPVVNNLNIPASGVNLSRVWRANMPGKTCGGVLRFPPKNPNFVHRFWLKGRIPPGWPPPIPHPRLIHRTTLCFPLSFPECLLVHILYGLIHLVYAESDYIYSLQCFLWAVSLNSSYSWTLEVCLICCTLLFFFTVVRNFSSALCNTTSFLYYFSSAHLKHSSVTPFFDSLQSVSLVLTDCTRFMYM